MRLSAKGRYALVSTIHMAQNYNKDEYITLISISERFNISKIYLEQVFSLLKRGGVVNSIKGSQGGYQLADIPEKITVYDILSSVETTLFESTEDTIGEQAPEIETAVKALIYEPLDSAVKDLLSNISLSDLVAEVEKNKGESALMYFI
ncbi:MAG: Rrf2 family transcriptional regulator [Clostridiales bacterium]|mgnify:CR=1 FL=1|nr:Rrf2 family transcriptional regulator [Clostridiales bacterium]